MRWLLVLILFCSCTTSRKAINYMNANEDVASQYCAEKYPIKVDTLVEVKTDTFRLETILTHIDSVNVPVEFIIYRDSIKEIIKKQPPTIVRETIIKENTAKIKSLELKIIDKDKEIAVLQSKVTDLRKFKRNIQISFFIAFIIVTALLLWRMKSTRLF